MNDLDVFMILKDGINSLSESELREFVELLAPSESTADWTGAVDQLLENMFWNLSKGSVRKRERIIRAAERKHANPKLKSDFCRNILRKEVWRLIRKDEKREAFPKLDLIYKQIEQHLRAQGRNGSLHSQMKYGANGQHIAKMWGLAAWGWSMRERKPHMSLKKLRESLPEIRTDEGGKGMFKYRQILPQYFILMLETWGAPLSTAQIKSVILDKLYPPPFWTKSSAEYLGEKTYDPSPLSADHSQVVDALSASGEFDDSAINEP